MIMATEKRKSTGAPNTPSKFAKKEHGKGSPSPFKGKNQQQAGTPGKQQKGSPQKQTPNKASQPPPPPKGAKQLKVEVKQELQKLTQETKKQGGGGGKGKAPQTPKGKGNQKNGGLNKVSEQSKNITKDKHTKKHAGKRGSRQRKLYDKLIEKPRPEGACERALQAEKDFGHTGRVFTVKLPDPVVTEDIVRSWSNTIETAVFPRSIEPRQFFVVFKNNANVKKEVENLKKVSFGGGKLQVEEKLEGETRSANFAEQIDPFSLYLSNLHETVTREDLQKLFGKATTVSGPKKHGPKTKSQTKFAFVIFDTAEDALAAFKEHYTTVLSGNTIVMRFRRIALREMQLLQNKDKKTAAVTEKKVEAKATPAKKQPAKATPAKSELKKEPVSDSDEDEEEDDSEDEEEVKVGAPAVDEEDDDDDDEDEDDDDDDLEEEEDDDEDDDDDDDDDDE